MNAKFLTKTEYFQMGKVLNSEYWTRGYAAKKWGYHERAVQIVSGIEGIRSDNVLEMGTMGVQIVHDSDTIDFVERYPFEGKNPTFTHDGRLIPWPIKSQSYLVFIALRVFMHLVPNQKEAFLEARRISRYQILVVPYEYPSPKKGITYEEFVNWLDGVHPNIFEISSQGALYIWDKYNPSFNEKRNIYQKLRMKLSINKSWLRKLPFVLSIHKFKLFVISFFK